MGAGVLLGNARKHKEEVGRIKWGGEVKESHLVSSVHLPNPTDDWAQSF